MSDRIPYFRHELGEEEIEAVVDVLRSGWIARGPRAGDFEEACATRLQASHAIACANGSVALEIALRGLGLGPGDEVIVPTLTWIATAMAVSQVGAKPVFCDIDADTHNLTCETVEAVWSDKTRAVIAVDMAGVPADIFGLKRLVEEHNAFLIEDAAHAFGAVHIDGPPVGGDHTAHVTTFSFHPAKTITTAEGGLITTRDPELAERMRRLRSGGITRDFQGSGGAFDYLATEIGSNHHMTEMSAALGLVQLNRLNDFLEDRRGAFDRMLTALDPLMGELDFPAHPFGSSHNLFIVELAGALPSENARNDTIAFLRERGVMAHMNYPLLHRQPIFGGAPDETFPVAERYGRSAITLPLFPGITHAQIARVADTLNDALSCVRPELVATKAA